MREALLSNKEKYLGEFEQVLLLALIRLGKEAYGAKVRQLLKETIEREVSIGAMYATLERLEGKGLVLSSLGESTPERGGRAKRYFEVSAKGKTALKRTRSVIDIMWQDVTLMAGA